MVTPPLNPRHAPFHLLDARVYFALKSGTRFPVNALRPPFKSSLARHAAPILPTSEGACPACGLRISVSALAAAALAIARGICRPTLGHGPGSGCRWAHCRDWRSRRLRARGSHRPTSTAAGSGADSIVTTQDYRRSKPGCRCAACSRRIRVRVVPRPRLHGRNRRTWSTSRRRTAARRHGRMRA